jgi:methylglyoxal synthase
MNTSKNYSEEYVVQALVRLAKAYKISQSDNSGTADYSGSRLFFTPPF